MRTDTDTDANADAGPASEAGSRSEGSPPGGDHSLTDRAERVAAAASEWPGVETTVHRFDGTAFLLGRREVGHVHRFGVVDVNFSKRLRDALIAEGRTGEHHVVPESGWTTLYLDDDADVDRALWLLRLSYLYQALTLRGTPPGEAALTALDVDAELDALAPSADVRGVVADLRARR